VQAIAPIDLSPAYRVSFALQQQTVPIALQQCAIVVSSNVASSVPQFLSSRRAIHLPIDRLHSLITLSDNN
jgi:hypothetical protein